MGLIDYIVVGSGATGSIAAKTLLDMVAKVLLLDGGQNDDKYSGLIPDSTFSDIRKSDPEQYRYFLGDDFEALCEQSSRLPHLTPPRLSILAEVDRFLKFRSTSFLPIESLALGGLGRGWGLGCAVFSGNELRQASLPISEMDECYQTVANWIGISGASDDATPYTIGNLKGSQPSIPCDGTAKRLLDHYKAKRTRFLSDGFRLGRPALALLTQEKDGRSPTNLRDMDFYSDSGQSAWRPQIMVENLLHNPSFAYCANTLVTRFDELDEFVEVSALDMHTLKIKSYRCKRLVLAAGVLGTARIVLRSAGDTRSQLPLLCNPYTYIPCIVPQQIGVPNEDRKTGLAQLILIHDATGDQSNIAQASIYSYRALMFFRLLNEMPLNMRDGRKILQHLLSSFLIAGIHHPQTYTPNKYLIREYDPDSPTQDRLNIVFELGINERQSLDLRERNYMKALRRLGAWPMRRVQPRFGASIHYAGTLPYSDSEKPFTLNASGKLARHKNVYVADGSGFTFLPAKGLTLSLMANAHRVAKAVGLTMRS